MKLSLDIRLDIDYNEQTKEYKILSCNPIILNENNTLTETTHILTETQQKFGILTLGAQVGKNIPKGNKIKIFVNGELFNPQKDIYTHKTVKGRIDGLTDLYRSYPELTVGTEINVIYDVINDTMYLNF